jgi:hypothetical protein
MTTESSTELFDRIPVTTTFVSSIEVKSTALPTFAKARKSKIPAAEDTTLTGPNVSIKKFKAISS